MDDPAASVQSIDPISISETIVTTLLTLAADAKGDNFVVDKNDAIIGIDNDHVFTQPYTKV